MLYLSLETVVDTAINTAACSAKIFADIVAGTAAQGAAGIAGALLMSGLQTGVLSPLFQKTVQLNDAWTAVMTVARSDIAMVAENCCCKCCWAAGDIVAGSAAGTTSIINLMDFQMSVLDLLPSITLVVTFLSKCLHWVHIDLDALLQAHQVLIHFHITSHKNYCKNVGLILEVFHITQDPDVVCMPCYMLINFSQLSLHFQT